MPQVAQGDIFSFAKSADLLIVFGHRGFNEMDVAWSKFRDQFQNVDAMGELFASFDAEPYEYASGKFIVTVADGRNHGLHDTELLKVFDRLIGWAHEKRIKTIATNGIADVDHDGKSDVIRSSDDCRAQMLIRLAKGYEDQFGLKLILASLNDVFVRQ